MPSLRDWIRSKESQTWEYWQDSDSKYRGAGRTGLSVVPAAVIRMESKIIRDRGWSKGLLLRKSTKP
jgi:hypothetical protein